MWSRTTTSLCRNMKRSLNEGKSSFYENTKRSMMSANVRESSTRALAKNDSEESVVTAADVYASGSENEGGVNIFRDSFKRYKKRVPPPDLYDVIDTRVPSAALGLSVATPCPDALTGVDVSSSELTSLGLRPIDQWRIATFDSRPGLYVLPDLIREDAHSEWLRRMFRYAEPPNTTNLTAHGGSPDSDVLAKAGRNLRWVTMGVEYDWDTKEYPITGRPMPSELVQLAEIVSSVLGLGRMSADAAIVNFYPPKATLSPHVDRSERCAAPLISLSVGQSAVYLTGGVSLSEPPLPIWLRSGDVLVMHGAQRLVYHGVPAVIRTRDFRIEDDPLLEKYANESRVNITIRQVNP